MLKKFSWKAAFSHMRSRIFCLYTGPAQKKAIAVTAIAALSVTSISAAAVYTAANKNVTANTAYAVSESTEQATTLQATATDATATDAAKTIAETTTVPETTTPPPETTTEETTVNQETQAETTAYVPEVIPVEKLEISSEDLSTKDEVINRNNANSSPAIDIPESPEIATNPSSNNNTPVKPPSNPSAATLIHGIDVSRYQGQINWSQVKNDGIDFAFIKVAGRGYGTGLLYYDTYYKENLKNAALAGVKVGAYFFSQAISVQEAVEEASMMINALKGYNISYPVVFDWETSTDYRTNIGLSKATMTAIADTFCSMIEAAGYKAMVYANTYDFERFDASYLTSKYASWLARYPANYNSNGKRYQAGNALPPLNYPYQIWQYSSTGSVKGISGNVDMNVSFKDFYNPSAVYPIKLEIPQKEWHTCVGRTINPMENIKCYNSAGIDCSDSVTYTLTNSSKETVSLENAIMTADTYKITYSVTDFTGNKESASAVLYVEQLPSIILTETELFVNQTMPYDELISMIENNLVSCTDFNGTDITDKVVITYPSDFYTEISEEITTENQATSAYTDYQNKETDSGNHISTGLNTLSNSETESESQTSENITDMVPSKKLIAGTYVITYSVTDSQDYSNSVNITLNIIE